MRNCCCPPKFTSPSICELAATPPLTQESPSKRLRSPCTCTRRRGEACDTVHSIPFFADVATFSIDLQKVSNPLPCGGRLLYFWQRQKWNADCEAGIIQQAFSFILLLTLSSAGTNGPLSQFAKRTSVGLVPRPITKSGYSTFW